MLVMVGSEARETSSSVAMANEYKALSTDDPTNCYSIKWEMPDICEKIWNSVLFLHARKNNANNNMAVYIKEK